MAIVGWHLVRMVNEAGRDLVGARVESVRYDRTAGRLLLILGSPRGKRFVVAGVRGSRTAFFWTSRKSGIASFSAYYPTERFNRVKGARLVSTLLPGPDRFLFLSFERAAETTPAKVQLRFGWTGGQGNIWLVDTVTGHVLEKLHEGQLNSVGETFRQPPPPKFFDWRTASFRDYRPLRVANEGMTTEEFLVKRIWGIDALTARAISRTIKTPTSGTPGRTETLWAEFEGMLDALRGITTPGKRICIESGDTFTGQIRAVPGGGKEDPADLCFLSLAEALATVDLQTAETQVREDQSSGLRTQLERLLRQAEKRLAELNDAVAHVGKAADLKHQADLLGAQRHLLQRGMESVEINDWDSGKTIVLRLDSGRSPQQNIEDYYRRARKIERTAENARKELPELIDQVARFEQWLLELKALEPGDPRIEEIASASGYTPSASRRSKKTQSPRLPYREYALMGHTVLVGRSNRDNDELTRRIARPDDLFFHADQVSGSHVILRNRGRGTQFPQEVINATAQIAAFFSKAKHSGLVSVMYTEIRHVSKPRKAPAGLVRITREKSVMVQPAPPPGYHGSPGAK